MIFNPKSLIDKNPMTALQYSTIFICFLMNMLDGMDVLVISYTAPAIAKAWSISPANLGIVFSSGLVGMTVGAIFLAPFADRIGRKSTMLIAGLLMATCIYLTSFATDINLLMIFRFISGLGIGAMMATTAALTAENSPTSTRNFWVSTVVAGYPVGAGLLGLEARDPVVRPRPAPPPSPPAHTTRPDNRRGMWRTGFRRCGSSTSRA